jgi:uncharacterized protein (TIRG00374 family)
VSRPRIRAVVVLVVTVGALLWAVRDVDPGRALAAIGSMDTRWIPAALAAITAVFFARVARFQLLLGDARPSFARQSVVCAIAFLGINVVPFRLGEFIRSLLLLDDGVDWGTSLSAVVLERIVDLFCLLGMLLLITVFVSLPATVEVQGIDVLSAGQRAIAVVLVGLIAGLLALAVAHDAVVPHLARTPAIGERAAFFATQFRNATVAFARAPLRAVGVSALAVCVWVGTIASVWMLLQAFPGVPARWDVALAVTAFTVAGTTAVPTPGFFGPFEVFCKAVLVLWAVEPTVAATFAVVWHLHQFGFHVVTGGAMLFWQGLSLTELVHASRLPR